MQTPQNLEKELAEILAVEPRVEWSDAPPQSRVTRLDVWTVRLLILAGLAALGAFVAWFFSGDRIGSPWLFWPVAAIFAYGFALMLYEWYCYLGARPRGPVPPPGERTVDILTTWVPGEPREMVVATLKAVQRIPYPHTTYLCDEGDDPLMRAVCEALDVRHVTRIEKVGAKAGNINNALRQATGEIAVILDPDHEPAPFFLDRLLGYFDDPKVGFVQCVQGYYNQGESLIACGAAEQTYHFYGPVMTGMHGHGTTQAIGANCAFRRAALDSIGGHAIGLAEDMATTLKLYAKGWTSVYVPETLTRGLVPNTLGAYYQQQIKWSCGVWDILIESLPSAWPTLDWKNRLHFLHNGLFYLRGLFVFFAILIPIVALFTGLMPWKITLQDFLIWFGPLFAAQILIRQAAQRWLMEPSEHGLHLVGGFLMNATWWVHLAGATSAMRRKRIPYIPTPKDDEASDAWSLAAPNLMIAVISFAAAAFGLWYDRSPFALLMACFAIANGVVLGFVSLSAQQKTLARLLRRPVHRERKPAALKMRDALFWILREQPLPIAAAVLLACVAGLATDELEEPPLETFWAQIEGRAAKETGGFILGLYHPEMDDAAKGDAPTEAAIDAVRDTKAALGTALSVVSLYHWWGDQALADFPRAELDAVRAMGSIPMITWGPSLTGFSWAMEFEETAADRGVLRLITEGRLDYFIEAYANEIREFAEPVMIRFAHEMDNPQYPWSPKGGNTPEEFVAAWRYVVEYFNGMGVSNVAWVWNPWTSNALGPYYPGDAYVDWVGLTLLNFGVLGENGSWKDFEALYAPFENWARARGKPVMLAEFGSTALGGDRTDWIVDALDKIAEKPEIEGVVFFDTNRDANVPVNWSDAPSDTVFDWKIDASSTSIRTALSDLLAARPIYEPQPPAPPPTPAGENRVDAVSGGWQLTVDGEPFFIQGVAYGTGQDWRVPREATRWQVERDFQAIAAMGANTIRRYGSDWTDSNVLRAAKAQGLKVLMGFELPKDFDYAASNDELARIERDVLEMVRKRRSDPTILMWVIGNEVWGLMKHHFARPYLTENRTAYLRFLDRLTRRIKEIDPLRPVATAFEASGEIHAALGDLDRYAPAIDVVGINAYYDAHLRGLVHSVYAFGGGRPWFLSEFGPDGYWDLRGTTWSDEGFPLEPADGEKARQYEERWRTYVADLRPMSLGGVAFSWADRYEGSPTWFGLTDFEGRMKAGYFSLKQAWSGPPQTSPERFELVVASSTERAKPGQDLSLSFVGGEPPVGCAIEITIRDASSFKTWGRSVEDCALDELALQAPDREGRYWISVAAVTAEEALSSTSLPLLVTTSN